MQTIRKLLGLDAGDENVLMIDRYQMGRMKLKDYFIRDQFSEERHNLGHSKVYFWQHRGKDSCTVKVHATTTDSNESAHKVMDHFMSNVADPSAFLIVTKDNPDPHWLEKTEAEKVHFVNAGTPKISAVLIWGNIFLHIQSSGEQEHSIKSFLDNLKGHWAGLQADNDQLHDFELGASKTALKVGEVAMLSKKGLDDVEQYNSLIYAAGPKRLVDLFEEEGVIKLKIKPSATKVLSSPVVILMGLRPDGKYVRSKPLKFTIVPE